MRIGATTRAVVTGAGSGLGRALAKALAARGATVVVSDVREDGLRATAEAIAAAGGTSHVVPCDVSIPGDVERLAAEAGRLGEVDLIVNNAGIGVGGEVGVVSLDAWRRTIDVNLLGVVYGCHYFVPGMRARRRGHVLNVASAAAFGSAPTMGAYNATKAAVVSLSETLAAEARIDGVGVTVLCPGFFKTEILAGAIGTMSAEQRRFVEGEMARSKHDADDVARLALEAVEAGKLYAVPHAESRWLWRVKRLSPTLFAKLVARVGRRSLMPRQ
jgi:short-subunit dehydrogenase